MIFHCFEPLVSNHLTHSLISLCSLCALYNLKYMKNFSTHMKLHITWCNLEITCNQLSSTKMCRTSSWKRPFVVDSCMGSPPVSQVLSLSLTKYYSCHGLAFIKQMQLHISLQLSTIMPISF